MTHAFTYIWNNRLRIAAVILGLLCIFQWVQNCVLRVDRDTHYDNLQIALQSAKELRNQNGALVYEVKAVTATSEQLQYTSDSLFNLHTKDQERIKEVTMLAMIKQAAKLDTPVLAQWTAPVSATGDSCIKVPAEFAYETEDISLHGTVRLDGVQVRSLYMPNMLYIREATKRSGFLGWNKQTVVQWHNTNKLWTSDSATYYTVKQKPSRWNRWIKPVLCAVGATAATIYITR